MNTSSEALRNLYVALGGNADDVKNLSLISELINAIAELFTNGTFTGLPKVTSLHNGNTLSVKSGKWSVTKFPTELPDVSEDDNGKVLKVIEGVWDVGDDNTSAT